MKTRFYLYFNFYYNHPARRHLNGYFKEMNDIRLENITKYKGNRCVFSNISLHITSGEFFALLGPSGCGKTTLLRLISGLDKVDKGKIFLGNKEITGKPPNKRSINLVFQNYALFPHLSVLENIGYSLSVTSTSKEEICSKVDQTIRDFHLEDCANKKPNELSGGQQQRVAIARAIISKPSVLLLDEPLAALDFKLREKLLVDLIDLQDRLCTTFIYVTHDQHEALTVADRMGIMTSDGNIAQQGTPQNIYEYPNSIFVANFVGKINIFEGEVKIKKGKCYFEIPNVASFLVEGNGACEMSPAYMCIRPEKISISTEVMPNSLKGVVSTIIYTGCYTQYEVIIAKCYKVQVFLQNMEHSNKINIDYDGLVYISWKKENVLLLQG